MGRSMHTSILAVDPATSVRGQNRTGKDRIGRYRMERENRDSQRHKWISSKALIDFRSI